MSVPDLPLPLARLFNDHGFASGAVVGTVITVGMALAVNLVIASPPGPPATAVSAPTSTNVAPDTGLATADIDQQTTAAGNDASSTPTPPATTTAEPIDTDGRTTKPRAVGTVTATWQDVAGYKTQAKITIYPRDIKNFEDTNNPHLREAAEGSDTCNTLLKGPERVYSPVADVDVEDVTGNGFENAGPGVDATLVKASDEDVDSEAPWLTATTQPTDAPLVEMIVPTRLLDMDTPCLIDESETLYGFGFYGDGPADAPEIYAQASNYVSPNRPEGTPIAFDGYYLVLTPGPTLESPTLIACEATGGVTFYDSEHCWPNVL